MACNTIPQAYPSLVVHLTEAEGGATGVGPSLPLLINTAANIGEDRAALRTAQKEYRAARSAISPLAKARRDAINAAYEFCFKTRDMLENFLGREWNELWVETGWVSNLIVPRSFDDLYELSESLVDFFTANPSRQNEELDITIEAVTDIWNDLRTTNQAVNVAERVSLEKRDVRDTKMKAARKRLNGLCKELSQRLDDMDPRWRDFGFNMPGAATVPEIPVDVVVTPLPAAKLQIACAPSANATNYRFYVQRVIIDPEPIHVGTASEPLFVTESLVAAQPYVVYVSAVNEGAESDLSDPVGATPVLSAAA